MGSRASSIWGAEPDKYGKWNCRCFDHFCLHIINHFRHKKLVSHFKTLKLTKPHIGKKKVIILIRDPEVGPRFWFLADSIRLYSPKLENISREISTRHGTLGLTGKQATVEDEVYVVKVYLTTSGNLKVLWIGPPYNTTQWPTIISLLNLRSNLSSSSKVGLHPKQKNMKGRVAVRVCWHHITLNWPLRTPPTPGGRHPAHAWPQHRAGAHQDQGNQHGLVTIFWTIYRRARATRRLKWWSASPSSSWSTRSTS